MENTRAACRNRRAHMIAMTLIAFAALTTAQNATSSSELELDGSGSTVPDQLIWKAADMLMTRVKPAVVVTYRSIGTKAATVEFMGDSATNYARPINDFSTGDMPLSTANYQSLMSSDGTTSGVLQVPLAITQVSVFHGVPGIAEGASGLNLTSCLLAAIYFGDLKTWDDPRLVSLNPDLNGTIAAGTPIVSLYFAGVSGSTTALSNYMSTCTDGSWTQAGPKSDYTGSWASSGMAVSGAAEMLGRLRNTTFTLGYIATSQGNDAGLVEAQILNRGGVLLSARNADLSLVGTAANSGTNIAQDWDKVELLNTAGPGSWPMTKMTYVYLRRNLTFLGRTGGLLTALVTLLLSEEVQGMLWSKFDMVPLPAAQRAAWLQQLNASVVLDPSAPLLTFESGPMSMGPGGQRDYVVSSLRTTFTASQLATLQTGMEQNTAYTQLGGGYQVHGSGTWFPGAWLRWAQMDLRMRSRIPIAMTYRMVDTFEAQFEFLNATQDYADLNHFKVGDLPLNASQYQAATAAPNAQGAPMQIPFAIGTTSVFYNAPAYQFAMDGSGGQGVNLTACDLANIYTGVYTMWNQIPSLKNSSYSYNITAFAYSAPSANTYNFARYLAEQCASSWQGIGYGGTVQWPANVQVYFNGIAWSGRSMHSIVAPYDMGFAIASTPYSIGFMESMIEQFESLYGLIPNVYEAGLQVADGSYQTSLTANLSALSNAALDGSGVAGGSGLNAFGAPISAGAPNITGDWSRMSLIGAPQWPLAFLSYIYVWQNMAPFNVSGPVLKAFLSYMLSSDSLFGAGRSNTKPMPRNACSAMAAQVRQVARVAPGLGDWTFEERYAVGSGVGLHTFSRLRLDHQTSALMEYDFDVKLLFERLSAALPKLTRLVGVTDMANLTGRMLADISGLAASPVRLTYEVATNSSSAVNTFVAAGNGYKTGFHDILILDAPLPSAAYQTLMQAGVRIVQVPVAVSAVSLFYNGSNAAFGLWRDVLPAVPINLSPCVLGMIWSGAIKSWNNVDVQALNPAAKIPSNDVRLAYATSEAANLAAVRQYILAGCPSTSALPDMPVNAAVYNTQDQLAGAIAAMPMGLLGIMGAQYGIPYNLTEAAVLSQYKSSGASSAAYVKASKVPAGVANMSLGQYLLQPLVDLSPPRSLPTDDWSNFSLVWQDTANKGYYPITRCSWAILRTDLVANKDSGGLIKGLVGYMLTTWQAKLAAAIAAGTLHGVSALTAVNADGSPMMASAPAAVQAAAVQARYSSTALSQLVTATGVPQWPLVSSRADPSCSGSPTAVISSLWVPMDFTDAQAQAARTTAQMMIQQVAQLQAAQAVIQSQAKSIEQVKAIAVVAVVLSIILSVVALALAAFYCVKTRRLEVKYLLLDNNKGAEIEATGRGSS